MEILALGRAARAIACAAAMLLVGTGPASAAGEAASGQAAGDAGSAAAMVARHAALKDKLAYNQFRRPLSMDSRERSDGVTGEIHALIDFPFAVAGAALSKPAHWCAILLLHLNTKACRPSTAAAPTRLDVRIGRKHDQPPEDAHRVEFAYRVAAHTANYLQVKLDADTGPLGTRDYRISLEAAPVEGGQTFIRLSYAYSYGTIGRLAMQTYLSTVGRDKVGFTLLGTERGAQPHYIGGTRAVAERNVMRYYLAIEAHLGAQSAPPGARLEKSLRDWFAACERFPRQLHEMEQAEYLAMKRREAG